MHGNVYEWCLDWHTATLSGGDDPKGPSSTTLTERVHRGGSWRANADASRSSNRAKSASNARSSGYRGFRMAVHAW